MRSHHLRGKQTLSANEEYLPEPFSLLAVSAFHISTVPVLVIFDTRNVFYPEEAIANPHKTSHGHKT